MGNILKHRGTKKNFLTKGSWRRAAVLLLAAALFAGALEMPVLVQAASKVTCKSLCKAALGKTGGSSKLKYQTTKKDGFSGFTVSDNKKVSSLVYLCDEKDVYAICVVKASSSANATSLLGSMKASPLPCMENDGRFRAPSTEPNDHFSGFSGKGRL